MDERLTTASAAKQMASAGKSQKAQRKDIDSAAAVVLLQGVLDAQP
jgi:RNase H-fold protein (predicted Holliday junction resolvase)